MFRHTHSLGAILLLVAVPFLSACEEDPTGIDYTDTDGAERMAIPGAVTLEIGQIVWLTLASANDEGKKGKIQWSSSDPTVARVSGQGRVQALAEGSVTITADCGTYCVYATVKVVPAVSP